MKRALFSSIACICLVFTSVWAEEVDQSYVADSNKSADKSMQMSTLSLFASSFLAPIYLKTCHNQPSSWIYAGTSALYLVGEIANYSKYKNATEAAKADWDAAKTKEGADQQAIAFQVAEKQTNAAADAMKKKVQLTQLAALGFTAASAMAIVEAASPWFGGGVCTASTDSDQNIYFADSNINFRELNSIARLFDDLSYMSGERQGMGIRGYNGLKSSIAFIDYGLVKGLIGAAKASGFSGGAENSKKLQAVGVVIGAGSAAGLIWANTMVQRARDMVSAKFSGYTRAAVFAGNAALAYMVREQANKGAKQYEEAAKRHRDIAKQFTQISTTMSASGTDLNEVRIDSATDAVAGNNADVTTTSSPCFVEVGSDTITDESCSCKKTNSCKAPQIISPSSIGLLGNSLGATFSRSLKPLQDYSNQVYNGEFGSATLDGAEIGRFAGNMNKLRDRMLEKVNAERKKNGKSALNLDDTKNKWIAAMTKRVEGSLGSLGESDQKRILASTNYGDGGASLQSAEQLIKKMADTKKEIALKNGAESSQQGNAQKTVDPFANFDFQSVNESGIKDAVAAPTEEGTPLGNEDGEQIRETSKSLFSILSERYISSGYKRLFEVVE